VIQNLNLWPTPRISRNWWPICSRCGSVVESVVAVPLPPRTDPEPFQHKDMARQYDIRCHGEVTRIEVGLGMAYGIYQHKKRLPTVFAP